MSNGGYEVERDFYFTRKYLHMLIDEWCRCEHERTTQQGNDARRELDCEQVPAW